MRIFGRRRRKVWQDAIRLSTVDDLNPNGLKLGFEGGHEAQ